MNIKIVEETFNKELWNRVAPHPLQSWEWGQARAAMGLEVIRLGEFSAQELIKTFQFTVHKLPLGYKLGYLPRSVMPSTETLDFLSNFGKKNNLVFIKVEPYVQNSEFRIQNSDSLRDSPHPLFPEWTILLDLTKPEEELLKGMKPKTRYNIRLAQKKGSNSFGDDYKSGL